MSIIVCMDEAAASIRHAAGGLAIRFDDPAYIRAEQVLVEAGSRAVGLVFEQGYHALGVLPEGISLEGMREAHLSGGSHGLSLIAPVKVIQ